jgi:N-acyl-L-homoserine lactone synthetase
MSTALLSARRVRIRVATSTAEVDTVLRCRHRVYSEDHDYFSRTSDGRIHDRFDAYPETTSHIVAVFDGHIVGGVRYCIRDLSVGLPVDECFDFSPHAHPDDRVACGSMMFVNGDAERRGVATWLILSGEGWAAERGATVMVGVVNPAIERLFARLGYNRVGAPGRRPSGVAFLPVMKRLDVTRPTFARSRIDGR